MLEGTSPCHFFPPSIAGGANREALVYRSTASQSRRGVTLIETMTAMTILAVAGTTLLVGLSATTDATDDAVERTVALGLAQQLLDEVCGMRYMEPGGSAYDSPPLG